jgi:predicted tellurium resistance membrane protein TerC
VGSVAQMMDPSAWLGMIASGWSEIGHAAFWVALLQIMWINILLSGDNAVVIAMACRGLPHRQRVWGMILGAGVAVLLRVVFTVFVAALMLLPWLKIVGGLALSSRPSCWYRRMQTRTRPRQRSTCGGRCGSLPSPTSS